MLLVLASWATRIHNLVTEFSGELEPTLGMKSATQISRTQAKTKLKITQLIYSIVYIQHKINYKLVKLN